MNEELFPKGVEVVELPHYVDSRGALSVADGFDSLPFDVKRLFWITDVPCDASRGGHAHWSCHELVFAVAGSFEITIDDGDVSRVFQVEDPHKGIVVPAGAWCELNNFAPGTVCLVLASDAYAPDGYVNDKTEWRKKIATMKD